MNSILWEVQVPWDSKLDNTVIRNLIYALKPVASEGGCIRRVGSLPRVTVKPVWSETGNPVDTSEPKPIWAYQLEEILQTLYVWTQPQKSTDGNTNTWKCHDCGEPLKPCWVCFPACGSTTVEIEVNQ